LKLGVGVPKSRVDGAKLLVMINCLNGEQKTKPEARRPAAPLTLSRQQDEARCLKLNKWLKIDLIDFLMHYEYVRAAEGT
jgi:hypothetical protein